jgi:hypothetical protein
MMSFLEGVFNMAFGFCSITVDNSQVAGCSYGDGPSSCIVPVPKGATFSIAYNVINGDPWTITTSWTPLINSTLSRPTALDSGVTYSAHTDGFVVGALWMPLSDSFMLAQADCTVQNGAGITQCTGSATVTVGPPEPLMNVSSFFLPVSQGNKHCTQLCGTLDGLTLNLTWFPISSRSNHAR